MLTIIIPTVRSEKKLKETVYYYEHHATYKHELLVMEDAKLEGVDIMRDRGIRKAKNEWCLIVDAHTIPQRYYDLYIEEELKTIKQTDISCFVCERLSEQDFVLNTEQHKKEYGAHLDVRKGFEWLGLTAKWNHNSTPKPLQFTVPIILGGAYLINKEHYIKNLKGIWEMMKNYGKSEEVVSILNWKLGNTNKLLPITIGHMFRCLPPFPQITGEIRRNVAIMNTILADDADMLKTLNKPTQLGNCAVTIPEYTYVRTGKEFLQFNETFKNT